MSLRIPSLTAALVIALFAVPALASASLIRTATWQMDEAPGATVMHDSTGSHDGTIATDAASVGLTTNGSYYSWADRCPTCLPVQNSRIVRVPDTADGALDIPDPTITYTLEFRFRTTKPSGNYMQKGQSTTKGGQIKIQGPKGHVQCLFKGANGVRVGTGSASIAPLNDGIWHTVKCIHTATQVLEYVDGVKVATKNGSTGLIDNVSPFTVGGKLNCDQVTITCDYFQGDIDYITVSHG